MIEAFVTALVAKGGMRVLRAAVENRDLSRSDAADVVTALLEAVVSGQKQVDEHLERIEGKLDVLADDPYHAAMISGGRLLSDASPAHRRPEDRAEMLSNARQAFSEAIGYARHRPLDAARAEVMYGLTWLALGEPKDLARCLVQALTLLQREVLASFQLTCRGYLDYAQRKSASSTKWREAIFGTGVDMPDWTASNRFYRATDDYEAVWQLHLHSGGAETFPPLHRPHASAYDHPTPGLPVRLVSGKPATMLGASLKLGERGLDVDNRSGTALAVALVHPILDAEQVLSPDVSALRQSPVQVPSGTSLHLPYPGPKQTAACVSFGRYERVDLTAVLHTEVDWEARATLRRNLRFGQLS
jgi:hypothetical protein